MSQDVDTIASLRKRSGARGVEWWVASERAVSDKVNYIMLQNTVGEQRASEHLSRKGHLCILAMSTYMQPGARKYTNKSHSDQDFVLAMRILTNCPARDDNERIPEAAARVAVTWINCSDGDGTDAAQRASVVAGLLSATHLNTHSYREAEQGKANPPLLCIHWCKNLLDRLYVIVCHTLGASTDADATEPGVDACKMIYSLVKTACCDLYDTTESWAPTKQNLEKWGKWDNNPMYNQYRGARLFREKRALKRIATWDQKLREKGTRSVNMKHAMAVQDRLHVAQDQLAWGNARNTQLVPGQYRSQYEVQDQGNGAVGTDETTSNDNVTANMENRTYLGGDFYQHP
jgi:hypothetical protein